DDRVSLFESGAIAEYLDETHAPRLHPADPVQRAINRAWIEYLPSAVDVISGHAYAKTEAEFDKAAALVPAAFEKLEKAMARQSDGGPFFNGAGYSLVDAAYAPFLQRHLFLERIRKLGHIERFPRVKAWAEAIAQRPSTHSFPPAEFEAMYRDMVKRRATWISQFVTSSKAAAE
ncbi:MAG TPA: glutathione S-transferase family protein, partial [Dongiaceae bacterium]|nr:glutathione S-transferase family protein [Dongiaceae bacterium]